MESVKKPLEASVEKIQMLFAYDPITGLVWRKIDHGKGIAGQTFEGPNIFIGGVSYRITRIIWAIHHGCFPPDGYWIDHKNGIKADNRLINLRLATPTQNQQNKAGYGVYSKGVTWRDRKVKPWQAKIRINGERIHLGSFETEEEAAEAYRQAALEYHGEFACLK